MIIATIHDKILYTEGHIVSDSIKTETVIFDFPPEWDGFTKTAVFTLKNKQIKVILDKNSSMCIGENECYIPHEVASEDDFELTVFGIKGEQVITTTAAAILVESSGYDITAQSLDPTPSEYQQLLNLASDAQATAQSVREDADNGKFKGEKGDKGDAGDLSLETAQGLFAPLIKNKLTGKVVRVPDLANENHNLQIKVDDIAAGKNKFPRFAYENLISPNHTLGWTTNPDGTISVIRDNTGHSSENVNINTETFFLNPGTYTASLGGNKRTVMFLYSVEGKMLCYIVGEFTTDGFTLDEKTEVFARFVCSNGTYSEILEPQIEAGNTATEYEPFKMASVNACSTNMISPEFYGVTAENGIKFTDNEDGSVNIEGTSTGQSSFYFDYYTLKLKKGVAYTLSAHGDFSVNGSMTLYAYASPATQGGFALNLYNNRSLTFVPQQDMDRVAVYIVIPADRTVSGRIYPQLEVGAAATEYKAYKKPVEYICNENGDVPEIEIEATDITLDTDSDGKGILVTYNADTKRYIDYKIQQVKS